VTLSTYLPPAKPGGANHRVRLVTLVRPAPKVFEAQVLKVLAWSDLREERTPEILAQIGSVYAFWGTLIPVQSERMRHTRELLDAAVQFAMLVEMRFKHELACWRPPTTRPRCSR
jgi:hypothetical protein